VVVVYGSGDGPASSFGGRVAKVPQAAEDVMALLLPKQCTAGDETARSLARLRVLPAR